MTNEEARYKIRDLIEIGGSDGFDYKEIEALKMAIKALEQESCEDAISRQALLDNLEKPMNWTDSEAELQEQRDYDGFIDLVESMPSVTPKFTDAEIQKMQELEQAQLEVAYESGKAEMRLSEDCAREVADIIVSIARNLERICEVIRNDL